MAPAIHSTMIQRVSNKIMSWNLPLMYPSFTRHCLKMRWIGDAYSAAVGAISVVPENKQEEWQTGSDSTHSLWVSSVYPRGKNLILSKFFTPDLFLQIYIKSPNPKNPRWPHTTGPKPHQLKTTTPKIQHETSTPNQNLKPHTTINGQKREKI